MLGSKFRRRAAAIMMAGAMGLAGSSVWAQAGGGPAGFLKLPDSVIADFKADPAKFLDRYKSGGLPLSSEVKDLALTDPSTLPDILTAAKSTNSVQSAAIGAGLAEAAREVASTNPQLATQIQTQVVGSNLAEIVAAYIAVSNSPVTTSTAAGGGGAGGGAVGGGSGGPVGGVTTSGGTNGGAGSGTGTGSSGTQSPSSFNSLGGGGSPPSGGSTTATTTSTSPTGI